MPSCDGSNCSACACACETHTKIVPNIDYERMLEARIRMLEEELIKKIMKEKEDK